MRRPRKGETGVYMICHVTSGKVYVGSASWCLLGRWDRHRQCLNGNRHHSIHLQRAWNRDGGSAFRFVVLEFCDPARCLCREQFWIDKKESYLCENGYNRCPVAGNTTGRPVSKQTRSKISETLTGRKLPDDVKRKIRLAGIGRVHSDETKRKIGLGHIGYVFSDESKRKMALTKRANKSPFSREDVIWLRENCIPGDRDFGQFAMSKRFGVSRTAVQNVLSRVTWNDV